MNLRKDHYHLLTGAVLGNLAAPSLPSLLIHTSCYLRQGNLPLDNSKPTVSSIHLLSI